MWEVDHKEGWVPKNWRFQTVVPKRMLESPLDCKIECSRRGEQQRMRYFSSVQSLTRVRLFATPWISARQASVSITNSWSPLSQWCHPTISSSVTSFSSCLQSFSTSECFQMSHFFASGGQSIGVSASISVLPMNTQDWSPLGRTGWISLQSKGLSRVLQHHSSKASILRCSTFFIVQLSHPYMTTGKTIALMRWTSVDKVMSLLLNMLSRLVITFLSRSKRLLILWLQSPSAVILEPRMIKSATVSTVSPCICHEVMGLDAMILVFWMLSFKPTFSLSYFTFISFQILLAGSNLSVLSSLSGPPVVR